MRDTFEQSLRVLGLAPDATEQAIKEAYRDLIKVWHPDRFGSDARLVAKAQEHAKQVHQMDLTREQALAMARPA